MMTKEQFIKRIELIKNYNSELQAIQLLVDKITNGFSVICIGENLVAEIINIINEDLGLDDDLLCWWLYEDIDKVIYINEEGKEEKEISVRTLDELWNYINTMR